MLTGRGGFVNRAAIAAAAMAVAGAAAYFGVTRINLNPGRTVGEIMDSLDGVAVYYNGGVSHSEGRNLAPDGYNLGIKYQCVEFVKRYYYQHFNHRMPDAYGNAVDFFDPAIADGELNKARGLVQFDNGGASAPKAGDILVFDRWRLNPYGHVAIVSRAGEGQIEIVQQNPGPFAAARETFALANAGGHWIVGTARVLGWLRLPEVNRVD
jgi:surface antigen